MEINEKRLEPINSQITEKNTFKLSTRQIFVFIILFIASTILTFGSGILTDRLFIGEKTPTILTPTPSPVATPPTDISDINGSYAPNKLFFDDTILLITKDEPHMTVVASADRSQGDNNYKQSSRVSFFDGKEWTRKVTTLTSSDDQIKPNDLIKEWHVTYDQTRVLKQSAKGVILINNNVIRFETNIFSNEMSIRSLPEYTKFMSEGTAIVYINNVSHEAYLLYTRIYSINAAELVAYDGSFNLTTDWVSFWDTAGNFYHVDSTKVIQDVPNYQTHSIAVYKSKNESVKKAFITDISRDDSLPPVNYTISMGTPINAKLSLARLDGLNKFPNNSYVWYVGNVKGNIIDEQGVRREGIGIIEYINK